MDRRSSLVHARNQLGATRLLTVVGPGGVGKSRFAVRLAAGVQRMYAGAVWFISLSCVQPGGSVSDHVAATLGLETVSVDQEGQIAAFFGGRRGLLVLDGCEHVIERAAALVSRILHDCAELSVVVTSQAPLRIAGEAIHPLAPLSLPGDRVPVERSAVQLYLDRVSDLTGLPPTEEPAELADIAEICRRLGGIPLAIELAAARARVLSSRQILDRLDAPLAFLTGGGRDLPKRQRTVKATIAWSYQLCSDDERRLWRLMSVFAGDWDLESAERMLEDPPGSSRALDVVESLLERSIVTRRTAEGGARYAMLDTVKAFGVEMSAPEELARARWRHRDCVLQTMTRIEVGWDGPRQAELLDVARRELPDLRLALESCIAAGDGAAAATLVITGWRAGWQATGRLEEFQRWCERILDLRPSDTSEVCQLLAFLAAVEAHQKAMDACFRHLRAASNMAARLHDTFAEAIVVAMWARVHTDAPTKIVGFSRALQLQAPSKRFLARLDVEARLANAYDLLGDTETAQRMRTRLVTKALRSGERYDTVSMLMTAGIIAVSRGDSGGATRLLQQALGFAKGLGVLPYTAVIDEGLAVARFLNHDIPAAALFLGAARSVWASVGAGASFSPLSVRAAEVERLARGMVGDEEFEAAYNRGRDLPFDDAVALALGAAPGRRLSKQAIATHGGLSARERQVAALVGEGLSDREIAERLVISRRTAEGHVARSLMKLGLSSRVQLASWIANEPSGG